MNTKLSAPVDEKQLQRLGVTPGAAAHFSVDPLEKTLEGVRRGTGLYDAAGAYGISNNIKRVLGSKHHHTGLMLGIDNEGRGPLMLHNYTEGDSGTRVDPVRNFVPATNIETTVPSEASQQERLRAAAHGLRNHEIAAASGTRGYPNKNLLLAGSNDILQRSGLPQYIKDAVGKRLNGAAVSCAPGEGICSNILADSYSGAVGRERAAAMHGVSDIMRQGTVGFTPRSVHAAPGTVLKGSYQVPQTKLFDALKSGIRAKFNKR